MSTGVYTIADTCSGAYDAAVDVMSVFDRLRAGSALVADTRQPQDMRHWRDAHFSDGGEIWPDLLG